MLEDVKISNMPENDINEVMLVLNDYPSLLHVHFYAIKEGSEVTIFASEISKELKDISTALCYGFYFGKRPERI